MKKEKKEVGIVSRSGICIDGDILMNCVHEHSSAGYLPLRLLLAFIATFSTMAMANAFIGHTELVTVLFYHSLMSVLSIGLFRSRYFIVKCCGGVVAMIYLLPIYFSRKMVKYGFYIAVENYLKLASISPGGWGSFTKDIDKTDPGYTFYFMAILALIVSVGTVVSSVYRIDFPIMFLFTFPIFELGMYQGMEAPTLAVAGIMIAWVTVLAMHIINHTTNKAGRKNTFAVHERSKTFFFTSRSEKKKFYPVMMSYVSILTAGVFFFIVMASSLTGFTRPQSFEALRVNLHRAITSFSITNIDGFIEEATGGKIHRSVRAVGGTNGGLLGRNEGISFNGSTAMYLTSGRFNYTMYLRGYVAGEYDDNTWNCIDESGSEEMQKIQKAFNKIGHYAADCNYVQVSTNLDAFYGSFSTLAPMTIDVRSAEKSFSYTPYYTNYTSMKDDKGKTIKPTPRNDAFMSVKKSEDYYTVEYFNFNSAGSSWPDITNYLFMNYLSDSSSSVLSKYSKFVNSRYTEPVKLDSLDKAYDEIVNSYLDGNDYRSVYRAVKAYLNDNYEYDLSPGATPEGEDFLDYFLTEQGKGYCSYFATAGAQLLRKFGYPTRYVEGYIVLPGQQQVAGEGDDGMFRVRVPDQCAHAWAEVYLDGIGWVPAEFTPGYDNDNPELDQDKKDPDMTTTTTASSTVSSSPDSSSSKASTTKSTGGTNKKTDGSSKAGPKSTTRTAVGGKTKHGSGGSSTGTGNDITEPAKEKKPLPAWLKTILTTAAGIVIAAVIMLINRSHKLKVKDKKCRQGDLNRRVMEIFRYTLRYLGLTGVSIRKNITDLQLTEELIEKCREKHIAGADDSLRELTELAVKAQMSGIPLNETEAAKAAQTLRKVSNEIVLPRLNKAELFAAKFLHCLY